MATQAVSEEPHCFLASSRWSAHFVDEPGAEPGVPVHPVAQADADGVLSSHGPLAAGLAATGKWKAKAGEVMVVPNATTGEPLRVLLGLGAAPPSEAATTAGGEALWAWAALPTRLPAGTYLLDAPPASPHGFAACLGWALGSYSFDRYKKAQDSDGKPVPPKVQAKLVWPPGVDKGAVTALAQAFFWARDLINTPAEDLGPGHLVAEATALAAAHGGAATIAVIRGEELLASNFPAIHTVGRAAARPPALVDIRWSPPGADGALPLVCLVGKGVCFDSGGLDIKSAAGMKLMKKDMGGAALVLALAHAVMASSLPLRLRVLVPTVENAISGNAYRPLDVLRTRAGISVENGNTDAEGRLILSDALFEAASEGPDLLLDAATLTGAARVALGSDVVAAFTNSDEVWAQLQDAAAATGDAVWRLPLHAGYRKALESKVADISSTGGEGAQGGAILAALFLQEFIRPAPRWVHLDMAAWVTGAASGPGRPEGGEASALRALYRLLHERYRGTGKLPGAAQV